MLLTLLALPLLSLDCPALRRGSTFEVRPGVSASLRQTGDERFILRTGAQALQARGECSTASNDDSAAVVADFNFDGWRDVALRSATYVITGYYDLYLYRPQTRMFQKNQYSGSQDFTFAGNSFPEPDSRARTVFGAYRSAQSYASVRFCLTYDGLNLYPCGRGEALGLFGEAGAQDWTWFDPSGTSLAHRRQTRAGDDTYELWTVVAARLNLHTGPTLSSTSTSYIVRGDRVEVLELRPGWAHVTYIGRGEQLFSGWVQRSALR